MTERPSHSTKRLLSKTATVELKERIRAAIGGRTYRQVADQIGWSYGSVASTLKLDGDRSGATLRLAGALGVPVDAEEQP